MNTYFKVLQHAKPLLAVSIQYLIISLFFTLFSLVSFGLLIPTLDILFNKVEPVLVQVPNFSFSFGYFKQWFNYYITAKIVTEGSSKTLLFICIFIVTSTLLKNLCAYTNLRLMVKVRSKIIYNLRKSLFQKVLDLDILYFSKLKKGDLISRISNDIQEIENMVTSSLTVVFRDPLITIGYFIILFIMSVKLTLFTLILIPISGFFITQISKRLRKEAVNTQNILGHIISIFEETISGIKIVKAFTAEKFLSKRFDRSNKEYIKFLKQIYYKRDLASPVSEIFGVFVVVLILIYGGSLILSDSSNLSASQFITYLVIFSQILVPIKGITSALTNIQKGMASADRVFKIINENPKIVDLPKAKTINYFQKSIYFQNIYLRYEKKEKLAINGISFKIKKGETVALVGSSGSGKSTIAHLLPRFIEPEKGQILLDGDNINTLKINNLRCLIGIVSQESILFNDTISNNIAFGLEASEEDIIHAAKVANAHSFIIEMRHGYQTTIGDRGMKLSGGQQQRLSIARAILKNPAILILDEATSALDSESEKLVQEALNNLLKDRTSIIIAHRLSTIRHADKILVIQKGKIIECGNHEELITKNKVYKKLISLQK